MKAYTDLEQSKKLAEILPLESADGCYCNDGTATKIDANSYKTATQLWSKYYVEIIPCWSLAALMDILDRGILFKTPKGWVCQSYIEFKAITSDYYDNPIDACVAMIEKLHEQKLL